MRGIIKKEYSNGYSLKTIPFNKAIIGLSIILFIVSVFSSCKSSEVSTGNLFQKRKYNKGWYIRKSKSDFTVSKTKESLLITDTETSNLDIVNNIDSTKISHYTSKFKEKDTLTKSKQNIAKENVSFTHQQTKQFHHKIISHSNISGKKSHLFKKKRPPPQWLIDVLSENGNGGIFIGLLSCFLIGSVFLLDKLWSKNKAWSKILFAFILGILISMFLIGGAWVPQYYALFFLATGLIGLVVNDGTMTFLERFLMFLLLVALAAFYYWIYASFYYLFWYAILLQVGLYSLFILMAFLSDSKKN